MIYRAKIIASVFIFGMFFCFDLLAEGAVIATNQPLETRSDELATVENALSGRGMNRDYERFIHSPESKGTTYVEYWYKRYEKKRQLGLSLTFGVTPVLGGATTAVVIALVKKANEEYRRCELFFDDDDNCTTDPFLRYELTASLIGIVGGAGTLATLVCGVFFYAKGKKRANLLKPFLPKEPHSSSQKPVLQVGLASFENSNAWGPNLVLIF